MSLLRNAYTNRRKRKESLGLEKLPPAYYPSLGVMFDVVQEPMFDVGYKSDQSKVLSLRKGSLRVRVKGIRAFWSYLYGVNPSGSPKGISTLFEYVNGVSHRHEVKGWCLDTSEEQYKAMVVHKPRCIKILTNDSVLLKELLNKSSPTDASIWRTYYRNLDI